ncbi:AlpA family phage regulatory protein [Vibrio metoecus]|uniref:AlpA family transcriptional regulator n=1 Tax=Vibrio metoecus TaxID=1481663 RepID=A0A0Q0TSD5_VIBMT|nr:MULTISPECIES: AlpA family transcriptional regulator [Vibrio]EGR2120038.1 AlpA family transcriptional regulator [Vibrio cholerae]EGR3920096.1 AlpA family transcriptional regulator [Vibrio cholerae]EHP5029739.1 AlpA family transcriptional regulator [Vibrio cholerae]EIF2259342.1 AlpA family transcriptional regulator [Vibrio cholerae]EJL7929256.1 AlpA family transcriptional regulator [Vibrio cholerae]
MSHRIIRLPSVIQKTGLSRSSIYLRIAQGDFPKSISLGVRAVGWLEQDIEQWLDERISASKSQENEK